MTFLYQFPATRFVSNPLWRQWFHLLSEVLEIGKALLAGNLQYAAAETWDAKQSSETMHRILSARGADIETARQTVEASCSSRGYYITPFGWPRTSEEEMDLLQQEIAYSSARSDIEYWCRGDRLGKNFPGVWYDVDSAKAGEEKLFVDMAVRYLELQQLLRRHPENGSLVQPMDRPATKIDWRGAASHGSA